MNELNSYYWFQKAANEPSEFLTGSKIEQDFDSGVKKEMESRLEYCIEHTKECEQDVD